MNFFDITIIIIISFCLIMGLFKGLIKEVTGIIGVIAGFYGAYTYHALLTPVLENWIENPVYRDLLSFFIVFTAIVMMIGLISFLIRKFLKFVFLGWVDRTCGLIFGAAKGIIFASVIFIMITTFVPKSSAFLADSVLAPHIAQVSRVLTVFVSKNLRQHFLEELEGIQTLWKH